MRPMATRKHQGQTPALVSPTEWLVGQRGDLQGRHAHTGVSGITTCVAPRSLLPGFNPGCVSLFTTLPAASSRKRQVPSSSQAGSSVSAVEEKILLSSAFPSAGRWPSRSGSCLSHWILIVPCIQLPSFRPRCPRGRAGCAVMELVMWVD